MIAATGASFVVTGQSPARCTARSRGSGLFIGRASLESMPGRAGRRSSAERFDEK
jgi:hypothetical protein